MTIDAALRRLHDKCTPGVLPCLWQTAYTRLLVLDIARDDLADGAVIEYSDEAIKAEFDRLRAEHPDAPCCECHAGPVGAIPASFDSLEVKTAGSA